LFRTGKQVLLDGAYLVAQQPSTLRRGHGKGVRLPGPSLDRRRDLICRRNRIEAEDAVPVVRPLRVRLMRHHWLVYWTVMALTATSAASPLTC
jgi:hypothetical protein